MSADPSELFGGGLESLPDLLGSAALVQHLESTLAQLEAMQGGTDAEARSLINMLKQQTAGLQGPANTANVTPGGAEGGNIQQQLAK
jgi:hypothetical protein